MKILVTTELWFPDYMGGSARVARESAIALASRGHEVTLLAPAFENRPDVLHVEGVEVRRRVRRSNILPRIVTDVAGFRGEARRLRRRSSFDVLLGHHVSSFVGAVSALPSVPRVHVFHASGRREAVQRRRHGVSRAAALRSRGVEPELRALEWAGPRLADRVLVLSDFSRELLRLDHGERVAQRVRNVGGAVDTSRYSPAQDRSSLRQRLGIPADRTLLLSVRRLAHRMGLENLLAAMATEGLRALDLELVIVGDGELRDQLHTQSKRAGLDSIIRWEGRVDDARLLDWYQAADLFVLPTSAYEGFGIATAESLACGTPVVGTPVGATPEVLAPLSPALVTEDASPVALARGIEAALPLLGPGLRGEARDYAIRELGWDTVAERWEGALVEASEASRRRRLPGGHQ